MAFYDPTSGNTPDAPAKKAPVTNASLAAAQATVGAKELAASRAETAAVRAADPLTNKSVKPTAPANTTAVWVGGTTTGGWKFQTNTPQGPVGGGGGGGQPLVTTTTAAADAAAAAAAAKAATDAANKKISDMNALALLKSVLSGYGIDPTGAISNAILGLQQANYDAPTIQALMEDPNSANSTIPGVAALGAAWNTRFAGNVGRRAAGLNPLTPAEYIATENGYAQVLNAAGVPAGFYDTPGAKAKLISGDISVTELQSRVDTAAKSISNQDPFYSNTLQSYYGLTPGQMIAHALDPATALPLLQRQQSASTFGAAASRQNLGVDVNTAQQYAALGVTQSQAEQGFQNISQNLPAEQQLASIYGGANTQFGSASQQLGNLTAATFGGPDSGEAAAKLKKLSQQEINAFSGSAGVDKNSLFGGTAGTY